MKFGQAERETPPRGWRRAGDAITGGVMSLVAQSVRITALRIKVYEGSTC